MASEFMAFRRLGVALIAGSIALVGCGAGPGDVDTPGTEDATQASPVPTDVGETQQASAPAGCDPTFSTMMVSNLDSNGVLPRSANGIANYWSFCFNSNAQIIVWVTDFRTGRQIGDVQFLTAAPPGFFLPGFFSGSIPVCPSPSADVMVHAIDFWGQHRADLSFRVVCP